MSLSELELFQHATHLGGKRPDGLRCLVVLVVGEEGSGGGALEEESATNFSLKL